MKFFLNKKFIHNTNDFNFFYYNINYDFFRKYHYKKNKIKNRKVLSNIRPGLTRNIFKNSIKRDLNNTLVSQFLNINQRKGKKIKMFNNVSISFENFNDVFLDYSEDFSNYSFYNDAFYLFNNNPFYSNLNYILNSFCLDCKSIFEIKSIKLNKKKKKPGSSEKYTHEIVYIPPKRRFKYVLKSISVYKEFFNNYSLWERLFWGFFTILAKGKNSFLHKKREFVYLKSIKFFKTKKITKK